MSINLKFLPQPLIFVAMLFFIIGIIDDKISINANLKFILTFILILVF